MPTLRVRTRNSASTYEVVIGRGVLSDAGRIAGSGSGSQAGKVAIISNAKVFALYGRATAKSFQSHGFKVIPLLMGDGEQYKSLKTAEQILHFLVANKFERTDALVALGGGVVGDLVGFTASIFLRGVPFIQIPTTLLAQIDSSIGGKTGVNTAGGKNLAGTFYQPGAVVVDVQTLATLPQREVTSGCCEMVKQGAVSSRRLFKQTVAFLKSFGSEGVPISNDLEELVLAHCAFKKSIVAQDEQEDVMRTDRRSRRVLNFGHTIGHALETVTRYRYFRHGEAVGYGMAAAAAISKNIGLLEESELELLIDAVRRCGPLPQASKIDQDAMIEVIQRDKKRAAGRNHWVLLERVGRPRIVSSKEITGALIKKSLTEAITVLQARYDYGSCELSRRAG